MYIFSKDKVIARITESGNADKITQVIIDDLNNFDGQPAFKSGWDDLVYGVELYVVEGKNGSRTKVEKDFLVEM